MLKRQVLIVNCSSTAQRQLDGTCTQAQALIQGLCENLGFQDGLWMDLTPEMTFMKKPFPTKKSTKLYSSTINVTN